jgi:hypothetical protein
VFGPGNRDVFAHLSSTFGDNASPEMLLHALRPNSTAAHS